MFRPSGVQPVVGVVTEHQGIPIKVVQVPDTSPGLISRAGVGVLSRVSRSRPSILDIGADDSRDRSAFSGGAGARAEL